MRQQRKELTIITYFHKNDAIADRADGSIPAVLNTIAQRYIGEHPQHGVRFRIHRQDGFRRTGDYRYEMDLDRRWPEAKAGQYVLVWGKLWSEQDTALNTSLNCQSPVTIYANGEEAFKSELLQELFPERRTAIALPVRRGWNDIVLRFVKTEVGFGGVYGTGSFKNFPLHILAPGSDREGEEGWLYSEPFDEAVQPALPHSGMREADTGLAWFPRSQWSEKESQAGNFARIFGGQQVGVAYAWSRLARLRPGAEPIVLEGQHDGALTLCANGTQVYASPGSGTFRVELTDIKGEVDLIACSRTDGASALTKWGFRLHDSQNGSRQLNVPHQIAGYDGNWLYAGILRNDRQLDHSQLTTMTRVFDDGDSGTYWQADLPGAVIRPFLENTHYGKWNYPLGVTLLGLLRVGRELDRPAYVRYTLDHIRLSSSLDIYALWDRRTYGAAGVNNQLSAIDSLDDCGSFGATMLEAMESGDIPGGRAVADRIAKYMTEDQERLPDGAFYRVRGSGETRQETMWCDDLYMSTPFLMRYGRLTGDPAYRDDAINQFLRFRDYLFLPEQGIMSHVYDFVRGRATGIPWGRGNGWVLFSLTELLTILPEEHERRAELLAFYRELCRGVLALQGDNGLWHQVLDRPDSYEETSCTSMFVYAFARGIRSGWLEEPEKYLYSVRAAWAGMTRISIDWKGNIYGVCRGSGYSFTALYYRDDLGWNLNDTHGIGIVLLAGTELLRLNRELNERSDFPVENRAAAQPNVGASRT
ncbi:glycoside hydrolase family 88/105 protein [Saccharibacillus sacchari]|uniref:Glycoside hydrolase family 88 protein n=1 Tax=Saccharibacillus sacchari TaxID=456493 RepID=A0ACC6P774_9BACL